MSNIAGLALVVYLLVAAFAWPVYRIFTTPACREDQP